jgi:hypothetical protein
MNANTTEISWPKRDVQKRSGVLCKEVLNCYDYRTSMVYETCEYGALVEWYWEGKKELLGENTAPVEKHMFKEIHEHSRTDLKKSSGAQYQQILDKNCKHFSIFCSPGVKNVRRLKVTSSTYPNMQFHGRVSTLYESVSLTAGCL